MQKGFQHILVPVCSTLHAELAIQRAAEWSDPEDAEIQVVDMQNKFDSFKAKLFPHQTLTRLVSEKWIQKYSLGIKAKFTCGAQVRNIADFIVSTTNIHKVDLVVIGANKPWWPFSNKGFTARLASSTGVPVLRLKRTSCRTTSIVVPTHHGVDNRLLTTISAISRRCPVEVHLVSYHGEGQKGEMSSLPVLQAYQWLKTYVKCPVEFSLVSGASKAKAVDNYMSHLHNDVLLLQ